MTNEEAASLIQKLRERELESYRVSKDDFLLFRAVLTKQEDFLSFRGNAQHRGDVIYTYEPGWTK
ncbi:hypothetical protein AJ85_04380 [Alkalihalobacillus alcalophilus ATCC 27647 = CGMCC 1.3604]|uniref:Abortive phage infection protein n=1 Tax=Alkalihalobacillus alcalophilus ATCC 27647 = CGMCC 1.3604 TaxID=1218173 RepID=A0A094WMW1_ALKAL|nr:hypothetical protein [Alkalihalobacillus alcalophilus]KGA97283.1 hypothetical protein BALCAV_0211315 [Alkalihalobacillus alcalophilus ATCC 27647 = CGMCC 1.3604]MED1562807.1 hypothetical protein [Alkalihalobacillus alcalophilus]THG91510.1 hypothetical protein AJ85_04380 [Alkalihalobacillus alcalophilus ATCC 27647 = CGMCC 1.3604]